MSALPGPSNPITYAQFYAAGGWRVAVGIVCGYAALVGGGIYLSAAHDDHPADVLEAWTHGLLALQIVNLFGYGAFRVNAAVRSDIGSRMIESHRLMPTPPLSAVAGYVLGAPAISVVLFAITVAIGAACVAGSGGRVSPNQWWVANGMIAAAAVCCWAVVAQFAFAARGGFVLLLIAAVVAVGTAASGAGLAVIPGLNVLTVPLIGRSVVALQRGFFSVDTFGVSLAVQAAVTAVCAAAAVRRYRSDTIAGFSPVLGLLLVATWVAASVVALRWPEWFDSRLYWRREPAVAAAYASTVAGGLLLAAVPIASAARPVAGPGSLGRRVGPVVVTVIVAAAVVSTVAAVWPRELPTYPLSISRAGLPLVGPGMRPSVTVHRPGSAAAVAVGSVLAWTVGTGGLFAGLSGRRGRAWGPVVLWIGSTWIGPVVADEIYQTIARTPAGSGPTWLTALSPVGAVAVAYDAVIDPPATAVAVRWGSVGQAVIAGAMVTAAAGVVARRRAAVSTGSDGRRSEPGGSAAGSAGRATRGGAAGL